MNKATPMTEPTFKAELVTPELAAKMLQENTDNRRLDTNRVRILAREMLAGDWMLTNQGIGVTTEHNLIDGQHRLHAVIKSGASVKILVCRDLDPMAKWAVDRLIKLRTAADAFQMKGCTNASTVASAIMLMNQFTNDGLYRRKREPMWQTQYDLFYDTFPSIQVWSDRVANYKRPGIVPSSVFAGLGVLFELAEPEPGVAERFMSRLSSGAGLEEDSPVLLLRARMIKNNFQKYDRLNQYAIGRLVVKTWNYVIEDRPMKQLILRSDEKPPKIYGFDPSVLPFYQAQTWTDDIAK